MPIDLLHDMWRLPSSGGENVGVGDPTGVAVGREEVAAIVQAVIREPVFRQESAVGSVDAAELVRRDATLPADLLGEMVRKLNEAV